MPRSSYPAHRKIIATLKFLGFVASLIVVPFQIVIMIFNKGSVSRIVPMLWMRIICAVFRIKVTTEGTPYRDGQVISMCNHLSYLDIPVIGGVIPDSFVSKDDVAKWPVIGFLAGLRHTAYVVRGSADPITASSSVEARLANAENLIIFPEGTSTDGLGVREFKRGVFARALDVKNDSLKIQPVTFNVVKANGKPLLTQEDRDIYAWHIGMDDSYTLPKHLWHFAQSKGAELRLIFHAPIKVSDYDDRKMLAKDTHIAVSKGLENPIQRASAVN